MTTTCEKPAEAPRQSTTEPQIVLGRREFRDRVRACWLGKNIGGTLGAPYEGKQNIHSLDFYDPIPNESEPNDDLDLQLVWLAMMEARGAPPKLPHFAEYWKKLLCAYPPDEYGFCIRNLDRGLAPPVSGWFENYYVDCMGAPIRSEIWACVAPANPQRAASLAWMDACLDHSGGEGMHGEMFWAAVESAAFVISDPMELIRIGLGVIPPSCRFARSTREAVWCWQNGVKWAEARDRIVRCFPGSFAMDAPVNQGFTIIGWLYGEDFGDKLCAAVNCGYDTDCTGATLGALLGILGGTAGIPERWREPIGEKIVLHKYTGDDNLPKTLDELTDRTIALGEKMAAVTFSDKTVVPDKARFSLRANDEAIATRSRDVNCAHALAEDGETEIILHYQDEPVILPGVPHQITLEAMNGAPIDGEFAISAPAGWTAQQLDGNSFELSTERPEDVNRLEVSVDSGGGVKSAEFVFLGPEEAKGFPCLSGVPRCQRCLAVKEHCICGKECGQ